MNLVFDGLAFDRVRGLDGLWLRLKPCPALRDVQRTARAAIGSRRVFNGVDDDFEPHATLGAWSTRPTLPALPVPNPILRREIVCGDYALGISGPSFQFAERLF